MEEMTIFSTVCEAESLLGIEELIHEAINDAEIPSTDGIPSGTFSITVTWTPEDSE